MDDDYDDDDYDDDDNDDDNDDADDAGADYYYDDDDDGDDNDDDDDRCRTASMKNIVVECKGLSRQQVNLCNTQNPKLQANAQNLKPQTSIPNPQTLLVTELKDFPGGVMQMAI